MKTVTTIKNSLTPEQRQEMTNKVCALIDKYETFIARTSADRSTFNSNSYFQGVADGLNHAYKLINQINDDYNSTDYLKIK